MVDMFTLSDLYNAIILKKASEMFIKENWDKLPTTLPTLYTKLN